MKQFSIAILMLLQQLAVEIAVPGSKKVVLSCMYRRPNGGFNKFNDYVNMFFNCKKNNVIFVCWDLNITFLYHGRHYLSDNLLDI